MSLKIGEHIVTVEGSSKDAKKIETSLLEASRRSEDFEPITKMSFQVGEHVFAAEYKGNRLDLTAIEGFLNEAVKKLPMFKDRMVSIALIEMFKETDA